MQSDFFNQKYEINKFIINSINNAYYFMIYYPKYHCELNYIGIFSLAPKNKRKLLIYF